MIAANLATFPPRRESMLSVVETVLPQVDRLNIVLNEYDSIPPELNRDKICAIIPDTDLKDTGKFYPSVAGAEYVFCIDDDVVFPDNFVSRSLKLLASLPSREVIASYHGSLYEKPKFRPRWKNLVGMLTYPARIADFRKVFTFYEESSAPVVVDQVATNTCVMPASSYPDWDFMKGSEKFVDVRLARWAFEKGLTSVSLPREAGWLKPIRYEDNIYNGFTKRNPTEVTSEILAYAFKVPGRGSQLQLNRSAPA